MDFENTPENAGSKSVAASTDGRELDRLDRGEACRRPGARVNAIDET